jgi:hypothetical protein
LLHQNTIDPKTSESGYRPYTHPVKAPLARFDASRSDQVSRALASLVRSRSSTEVMRCEPRVEMGLAGWSDPLPHSAAKRPSDRSGTTTAVVGDINTRFDCEEHSGF